MPARPLTRHVLGMVVGPTHDTVTTLALSYDPADPFMVRLGFEPTDPHPDGGVWEIDRDVLSQGLIRPSGVGDVRVGPHTRHGRPQSAPRGIAVDFFAPGEFGRVVLNQTDLREFLAATYEAVRAGAEAARLDIEATISRLMDAA
ncbi:SsgA family sporulation/cell division regulator [Nocardiopsis sp. FIRDI 009]|uniref:SsgA family sporulation/cell division regulator n=1 Tax=Nocardiopsis sp. FIRDI 009 TaxID=714197 RepID=UPI001300425C|nr:SsgA family sporulation/cell division regulator [Nocardiopsis sp. FIRDI 009]